VNNNGEERAAALFSLFIWMYLIQSSQTSVELNPSIWYKETREEDREQG
jgi:hypothetical protein